MVTGLPFIEPLNENTGGVDVDELVYSVFLHIIRNSDNASGRMCFVFISSVKIGYMTV